MNFRVANLLVALVVLQSVAGPANAQIATEFSAGIPPAPAPRGITIGPSGTDMWFTEETGNRVGRITTAGVITEFSAGISPNAHPGAITAGPDGNLWFAERNLNQIARLDPATGIVTEYPITAGATPSGLAVGPDNNLWFVESTGNRVGRMVVLLVNGTIGSFVEYALPTAGSTPSGIVLGPDTNLWFTEFNGNKIGRIIALPANGTVGTITEFGAGITAGAGLNGIAVGSDNNIWFTEINGNRIGKIIALSANGIIGTVTEYSAGITAGSNPRNIVSGPGGNLWFTETIGNKIGKITTSGTVTEFPTPSPTGVSPWSLVYGPDSNIWFTEYSAGQIGQMDSTGAVINTFSAGINPGAGPFGIVAGSDGNLWFTEINVDMIGQITPAGVITQFFNGITAGASPNRMALGPDGNVWFTEKLINKIGMITPAGIVSEFGGLAPGAAPTGITAGPDGNMWFTEPGTDRIGRIIALPINGTPGTVTEFSITPGAAPFAIAAGPDGNLWFTEDGLDQIGVITTAGTVIHEYGGITPSGDLSSITKGPDGNMWFTERALNQIGRIIALPANGTVGTVNEYSAGGNVHPTTITAGPDGNLWFTENKTNKIARITTAGVVTAYGSGITAGSGPFGIAKGPDNNMWFTENTGSRIGRLLMPTNPYVVTNNTDSTGAGTGSLRDAINRANADPGPNTVTFDPAVTGTITLTSGNISITDALTIIGPGSGVLTIDGNALNRIFAIYEINSPACPALSGPSDYLVTISGLTLTNGQRHTDNTGGAIVAGHSLTLDNVVISNSMAKSGGGVAFFAQYPGQSLTITNSQFLNNIAKPLSVTGSSQSGGALKIGENCGGTRTTPVPVSISNSLFGGNRSQPVLLSGFGGAIDFSGSAADISITDTRIVNNHVDAPNPPVPNQVYYGGGLRGTGKSLTITRSEISGNSIIEVTGADVTRGGAAHFYNSDPNLQGPADIYGVSIIDSTISGNSSPATSGALHVFGNIAVTIDNSTIANNSAAPTRTGGINMSTGPTSPPSAGNATAPTLTLASALLTNNLNSDLSENLSTMPLFTLNANNSAIQNICPLPSCNIVVSGSGNLIAVDPLLGPLANNGGPTQTHALLAGSPAINAGSNPLNLTTDQRGAGFPRVIGAAADMGAYELNPVVAPALQSAKSRKVHGIAGTFNLTLQ